jgi:hypothetical protein
MPKSKIKHSGLVDSWGRRNRKLEDKICFQCGKTFHPLRKYSKYCSRPCMWANNGGHNKKIESWWKNPRGYIEGRIWLPDGTRIRVKKARFVMEGILGRPLHNWEDVHHKDGVKENNSPDNLELLTHGKHSSISNSTRIRKKGYKLNLTDEERKARSLRAIAMRLGKISKNIISKTKAEGK